jgi:bacillithiol biosynthesis cysteine-adding enzyme BshC
MTLRFDAAPTSAAAAKALEAARRAQSGVAFPASAADALLAGTGDAAREGRELLLAGRALAVTTGQQPGLFTGPLYTVHKALTAAALAEALQARWGIRVVPVFWVAGDDHDFAEIDHCAVLGADGAVRTLRLRERASDAAMLPAFREPVGTEGATALAALEAALPPSEFRAGTLAWLADAYRPERSMAEAHAHAMAALLAPLGVVVCRGWSGDLKAAAGDLLIEALRSAGPLDEALAREAEDRRGRGLEAPVPVGDGMTLVMYEGSLGRDRLRIAGPDGAFETRRSGERLSLGDLEAVVRSTPERVSANVLLRPVVEARVLPTVAYVGGPAEVAYLGQIGPVFAQLGVSRPVPVPRLSGFLIEAKVDRVLARYGIVPADLGRPEGELASAITREALPDDAAAALADLRSALAERYAALQAAVARLESTLERPAETARNQALHAVDELEKRLVAALKRHNETGLQQLARARSNLFPNGRPQERELTVASFLARYGASLIPLLRASAAAHAGALLEAATARV